METICIRGKTEVMFYPERDFPALVRRDMGNDAAGFVEKIMLENKELFEEVKSYEQYCD
ncbi:hypothetical protein RWV98_17720 [Agathobaculum sp. NTUH-O15-33]|uniref:hypothetical protein n=1 Tax=Agathobaculum sp. NTUH-O15-33 TaxID=3079302 RepID=UPI002958D6F9|nr:hypothetical protein [Agathobaculum sp. NTUH-O15-33]WNX84389.1 hypothetical protein RWV98_17720 [Agathobaculum sp. NTUH-O15-33]